MELTIKVNINYKFEVYANPNQEHWDEADEEQKNLYVKEQVKDFILDNIDIIIYDVMDNVELDFT